MTSYGEFVEYPVPKTAIRVTTRDRGKTTFEVFLEPNGVLRICQPDVGVVGVRKATSFWSGFDSGEGQHGNSFLAQTGPRTYLFVQKHAVEFVLPPGVGPIGFFASPLGVDKKASPAAYTGVHIIHMFESPEIWYFDLSSLDNVGGYDNAIEWFSTPWHALGLRYLVSGNVRGRDGRPISIPTKRMTSTLVIG